jgi:hypothetical protein
MPKRRRGEKDQGTQSGDDRGPGAAVPPSTWHKGHLPGMPRDPSDNEPDFITGWLRERSLDGLFEDRAEDQQAPGDRARPQRWPERWATGSPWHRQDPAASDDLPDLEAECEDPPDRQRH